MKKLILIAISCIVVDQMRAKEGKWLTACRGVEDHGLVILPERVVKGQQVDYRPFIYKDDDIIHGHILAIDDGPPLMAEPVQEKGVGKRPQ